MSDYTEDELQHFINDIDEKGRNLTKWEEDFVESVTDQLRERGTLTERQQEILERIHTEKVR